MSDTTFRTKAEPSVEPEAKGSEPSRSGEESKVEVPYMDYEKQNGLPYLADYFDVGDTWNDPEGGFPEEISLIQDYLEEKISLGEMSNTVSAIKEALKGLEKVTGTKKEERTVMKIGKVAAYVEFLMKTDDIQSNLRRYGNK